MMRKEDEPGSESVWLMVCRVVPRPLTAQPDFAFFSWPEPAVNGFEEYLLETDRVEEEMPWEQKAPKLVRPRAQVLAHAVVLARSDALGWPSRAGQDR